MGHNLLIGLLLAVACFGQGRINAGGPAYTDALGQIWAADQFFQGGAVSTGSIPAGAPGYYVTKRYGDFSYLLPVPDGQYLVGLSFLENVVGPGSRKFSVTINGAAVLTDYDIAADVGASPVRKVFQASAVGNTGIRIKFTTVLRSAIVNAIDFASVVPPSIWGTCEVGPWDGTNGILPGLHTLWGCDNLSDGDLRITRATCRSDAGGQTLDVMVNDSAGVPHSILAAPIACTLGRAEGSVLPGASYPKGDILRFVFSIATGRQVVGTVTLQRAPLAGIGGGRALVNGLPDPVLHLALASATVWPIQSVTLPLFLVATAAPAALQWTVTYPADSVSSLTMAPGPSLVAAGKTLTCAGKPGEYACVAWGIYPALIPDGVVALLQATLSSSGSVPFGLTGTLGASPAASALSTVGQGGSITVGGLTAVRVGRFGSF